MPVLTMHGGSRPSSARTARTPKSPSTTTRRSPTTSLESHSGGMPPSSNPRPTSSAYTLAGMRSASTGSSFTGDTVNSLSAPTYHSSSARVVPSPSTTASAASSPTTPAVAGTPTGPRASGATSHSSTQRRSTRLPWTPIRRRPSSTTSWPSRRARSIMQKLARHGSVGTSYTVNFLDYDVYDLELTAVKNNTELRKLFIETTGKSIIVIEDIDCSADLTGKRRKDKKASGDKDSDDDDRPKLPMEPEKDDDTKVTLSGLLNFIDGLWSAFGGERIIIFTTNHKEKLDPALIRRGRMDKHIEMSYCRFEGFKVLAKNYMDVVEHELFGEIQQLLEETDMSPADVAENLMPMSRKKRRDPTVCLAGLIEALKQAKEDARAAKAKEEEEAKEAEPKKAKEIKEREAKKDEGKDKTSEEANGDIKEGDE
ncbi:hypothetical protein ACQJBY_041808 [Aegilops geniculata]